MHTYALKQADLLESNKSSKLKQKKSLKEESKLNSKATLKSREDIKKPDESLKKAVSSAINSTENNKTAEDSYSIMIRKLRLHELERDITNLRTILAHIIIPKLNTVEIASVRKG